MNKKILADIDKIDDKERLILISSLLNNMKTRPSWEQYYMLIAETVAIKSTCRRHVGAIIVKDDVIVAAGYNGAPSGIKHCAERGGCMRELRKVPSGTMQEVCMAVHAEQNAMIRASKRDMEGATLYVNTYPCSICTRMIINAKIAKIFYKGDYQDEVSKEMLSESNIEVVRVNG